MATRFESTHQFPQNDVILHTKSIIIGNPETKLTNYNLIALLICAADDLGSRVSRPSSHERLLPAADVAALDGAYVRKNRSFLILFPRLLRSYEKWKPLEITSIPCIK